MAGDAFIQGFFLGFSLILAIGAQNAFVLRQGLMRAHVFWICLICAVSDAILIVVGVAGIGTIADSAPFLLTALRWGGVAFLVVYGALSLRRAFRPSSMRAAAHGTASLRTAVLTVLAFTWLNLHVYLDTVGLIGAVSTEFAPGPPRIAYAAGAVSASFVFFFGLGYGARLLTPLFAKPRAWAVLDTCIAFVMWAIALKLAAG